MSDPDALPACFGLDCEVCSQLANALAMSTDPAQQEEIYSMLEQFRNSIPNFALYLLYLVSLDELSPVGRTVAAYLLKSSLSAAPPECTSLIKQTCAEVLSPILTLPFSDLVVSVSSLLASIVLTFGYTVVPDMSQSIAHLLSDESTAHAALNLCSELLQNRCELDSQLVELLPPFLESEMIDPALQAARSFAAASPVEVKGIVLAQVLPRVADLSPDTVFIVLQICERVLADGADSADPFDQAIVHFVMDCLAGSHPGLARLATSILGDNDQLPFIPEAVPILFRQLDRDEEAIDEDGPAKQCSDVLATLANRYPDQVLNIVLPEIEATDDHAPIDQFRRVIRCISAVHKVLPDSSSFVTSVSAYAHSPLSSEVARCLTTISPGPATAAVLMEMIFDESGFVRMAAMRCLCDIFPQIAPCPANPYLIALGDAFARLPTDEYGLWCTATAAFFEAVETLESENIRPLLSVICALFIDTNINDPLFLSAFEAIAAILPKIPLAATAQIVDAVGERALMGLQTLDDNQFTEQAFTFLSNVVSVDPASPFVAAALPLVAQHIRLEQDGLMAAVWFFRSHLIARDTGFFEPFVEPVMDFLIGTLAPSEQPVDVAVLTNIAAVLWLVLRDVAVAGDEAEQILGVMIRGMQVAGEEIEPADLRNIACCAIRILGSCPKLTVDLELFGTFVQAIAIVTDETVVQELRGLLETYVGAHEELGDILLAAGDE
jgi:hypothetical protein